MSTVLWANYLLDDGTVVADENDKWALFAYAEELDQLAAAAQLPPFSSLLDDTDYEYNMIDDGEWPEEGMASTDEMMAQNGVWLPAHEALAILEGLLTSITTQKPRLGRDENDREAVIAELLESIDYAKKAQALGARFNFAVIM